MSKDDERGAGLQLGLKNAEVALEHEGKIATHGEQLKGHAEDIKDLQDTKADKSKAVEIIKVQGWRVFGIVSFGSMMAWATGVLDAVRQAFK